MVLAIDLVIANSKSASTLEEISFSFACTKESLTSFLAKLPALKSVTLRVSDFNDKVIRGSPSRPKMNLYCTVDDWKNVLKSNAGYG
jgi:hypothetical protein